MATATAVNPVNMNGWIFFEPYDYSTSATSFSLPGDYYENVVVSGVNLAYDSTGGFHVTAGSVKSIVSNGGAFPDYPDYSITGLNHVASKIWNFLADGDGPGLLGYLFGGKDTINGSSGADVLNGYNGDDQLNGNGGNDKLNGLAGADVLSGGDGVDVLNGGVGDDTMIWGVGDSFNGSLGTDKLKVTAGNVDLTVVSNTKIKDTEQIDLGTGNHTLKLDKTDVLAMSSTTDIIKILGDAGDTVDLPGAPPRAIAGAFVNYNLGGGAHLLIDADVHVI